MKLIRVKNLLIHYKMNSRGSKSRKTRSAKSQYAKSVDSLGYGPAPRTQSRNSSKNFRIENTPSRRTSRRSVDSLGYGPMPRTPWTGRTYDSLGYGPIPRTPWTGPISSVKKSNKKSTKNKFNFSPKRLRFSPKK